MHAENASWEVVWACDTVKRTTMLRQWQAKSDPRWTDVAIYLRPK